MSRKAFLSACLTLLVVIPEAFGQQAVESPPQSTPSPASAAPPSAIPVQGNGQPDLSLLYPTIRPVADSAAAPPVLGPDGCLACDKPAQTFWNRPTFTGDWCGVRPSLQERGITLGGNLTQFAFGLGGGVNRPVLPALGLGNTFAYTGRSEYEMVVDLEKFGGMPKGKLLVRAQQWFGQYGNVSLNTGAFPPPIFASAIPPVPDGQGVPYITDFFITQPLSKNWVVYGGKKNVLGGADQDAFAGGNGTAQFLNQAFVANPAFLLAMPYTGFTTGFVSPREWGSFGAYVYDPQDRTKDFFAVDSLFSKGIIIGGEVKVKTNFLSLPGDQHFGGIWKHVNLTDLRFNEPPPGQYPYPTVPGFPTLGDSYTIYGGFDQYLHVYSEDTKRGWGLFGRYSISDGNPTPIRYFLSAGIGGYSPIGQRRGDTFGLAWYYTGTSKEFGPIPRAVVGPRDGTGVELFYNVQINPWMNLSPDFQIVKPEGGAIATTSYIGGIRLNIKY